MLLAVCHMKHCHTGTAVQEAKALWCCCGVLRTLILSGPTCCSTGPRLSWGLCMLTKSTSLPLGSFDTPWSSSLMRSFIRQLGPQPSTHTHTRLSLTWGQDSRCAGSSLNPQAANGSRVHSTHAMCQLQRQVSQGNCRVVLTPKYSGGTCTAALDTVPAVKPSATLASAARVALRASTGRSSVTNTLSVLSLLSPGLPLLVVTLRPAAARLHLSSTAAVLPARMDCCAATRPQLPSRLPLAMVVSSPAADPETGCALFSPPPCERRLRGPLQVANDSCTLSAALLGAVLHG